MLSTAAEAQRRDRDIRFSTSIRPTIISSRLAIPVNVRPAVVYRYVQDNYSSQWADGFAIGFLYGQRHAAYDDEEIVQPLYSRSRYRYRW